MGICLWRIRVVRHTYIITRGAPLKVMHHGKCGLSGMVSQKLLVAHPNIMRHGYMDYPWRITFRCATGIWTTSRCTMGIYITCGAPRIIYYQWRGMHGTWVMRHG
jgi:hypothetical protein